MPSQVIKRLLEMVVNHIQESDANNQEISQNTTVPLNRLLEAEPANSDSIKSLHSSQPNATDKAPTIPTDPSYTSVVSSMSPNIDFTTSITFRTSFDEISETTSTARSLDSNHSNLFVPKVYRRRNGPLPEDCSSSSSSNQDEWSFQTTKGARRPPRRPSVKVDHNHHTRTSVRSFEVWCDNSDNDVAVVGDEQETAPRSLSKKKTFVGATHLVSADKPKIGKWSAIQKWLRRLFR